MKRQKQIKTKNQRLRITLSIMVLTFCTVFLFLSNSANAQYYRVDYSRVLNTDVLATVDSTAVGNDAIGIPLTSALTEAEAETGNYVYSYYYPIGTTEANRNNNTLVKITVYQVPSSTSTKEVVSLTKGTDDYYPIGTVMELRALSYFCMNDILNYANNYDIPSGNTKGKFFKLTADIDFTATGVNDIYAANTNGFIEASNFSSIGGWYDINEIYKKITSGSTTIRYSHNFSGTFDGQGHYIKGLKIYKDNNATDKFAHVGLFGRSIGATIKNVGVTNSFFEGYQQVGAITGTTTVSNAIEHCYANNITIQGVSIIGGGIAGSSYVTNISYCYANNITITIADIASTPCNVGGFIGEINNSSKVNDCYAKDITITAISNNATQIGGYCGIMDNNSIATNCYANNIQITNCCGSAGGFVGKITSNRCNSLTNSYAVATKITRNTNSTNSTFGGFVGLLGTNAILTNCHYLNTWNTDNLAGTTTQTGCTEHTSNNSMPLVNADNDMQEPAFITTLGSAFTTGTSDNYYYPILLSQDAQLANGVITGNVVVNNASLLNGHTTVTIEDGASVMDNTNTITNVVLKQNCRINKWSFIGRTINTSSNSHDASTVDLINNNFGDVNTTSSHLMVASKFDYANNTWYSGDNYAYSTTDLNTGEGLMIYPLAYDNTTEQNALTGDNYTTLKQEGTVNTADVTINLTNNGTASGTTVSGLWFALANPYIGRLDVNKLLSTGGITVQGDLVYTYLSYINAFGAIEAIYPGQGFMVAAPVDAEGNSTTSISGSISKTQLIGYEGSSKTTPKYIKPLSEMITFTSEANNTTKEAYANINEQANNAFDQKDAYVLLSTSNEDLVEPYFLVNEKHIMKDEFKTMPYYAPMNFHASKVSNTTLTTTNIPENVNVSIINLSNGTETALENGSSFNFVANQGENEGRFVVKFGKNNVGIENNAEENNVSISMYPNPATSQTTLFVDGLTNNAQVFVNDVQGRTINTYTINNNQSTLKINTSNLASGVYYIRVVSNNLTKTEKLVVK